MMGTVIIYKKYICAERHKSLVFQNNAVQSSFFALA